MVLLVLSFALFIFSDNIKTEYYLYKEKAELPHYLNANQITLDEFNSETSEFEIIPPSFDKPTFIKDLKKATYYQYSSIYSDYSQNSLISLSKFLGSTTTRPVDYKIPGDKRFAFNEGLACFSCGCSCYADKTIIVADGKFFFVAGGKDYAMPLENQGIYYYSDERWNKLTPKLDLGTGGFSSLEKDIQAGKLKINNNACSLSYLVKDKAYKLDICK